MQDISRLLLLSIILLLNNCYYVNLVSFLCPGRVLSLPCLTQNPGISPFLWWPLGKFVLAVL